MDLVKTELERNPLKGYIAKSVIICGAVLGVMLLVFIDEEIYRNAPELVENWPSMVYIVSLISLFSFTILASVMYSKFIVTEYSGRRAILLFSYPIKRNVIVKTKCGIISVFTLISVLLTSSIFWKHSEKSMLLLSLIIMIRGVVYLFSL